MFDSVIEREIDAELLTTRPGRALFLFLRSSFLRIRKARGSDNKLPKEELTQTGGERAGVHLCDGHEEEDEHAPPELPLHRRRRRRPLRKCLDAAPGCVDLQALRRRRAMCRCRRRTFRVHVVVARRPAT